MRSGQDEALRAWAEAQARENRSALPQLLVVYGNAQGEARDRSHNRGRDNEVPKKSKQGVLQHGSSELVSGGDKVLRYAGSPYAAALGRSRPADSDPHCAAKIPARANT
jgi:hypothetical protein